MRFLQFLSTAMICGLLSCGWARTDTAPVSLFTAGTTGARSTSMQINDEAVAQLRSDTPTVTLQSVPLINGETANFTLTPMELFAPDAIIQAMGDHGTTTAVEIPDVRAWYGKDMRNPSRALFVAANPEGVVRVMVTGDEATSVTVISQTGSGSGDTYRIVPANLPGRDFCTTIETGLPGEAADDVTVTANTRSSVLYEIEMMIDVGYSLYARLDHDNTLVLNYLTDLFGAISTIYQRDLNTRFRFSHVTIWTQPDPFSRLPLAEQESTRSLTTTDQMNNYLPYIQKNRYHARRDLGHFIDYQPLGGLAYVNVLGAYARDFRLGVSNVYADFVEGEFGVIPDDLNTYFWDVMVVAHEIGHNVGSPHTHCFYPPIDCCARDCLDCPVIKPTAGTIMSYCHQTFGSGGSIIMAFHERCINMMRPKIENSLLLTPYGTQSDIQVMGIGDRIAPDNSTVAGSATTLKSPALGGDPIIETFTIKNIGSANLILTGNPMVEISGSPNLTIASQPVAGTVAPGESTTFQIQYNPALEAEQFATVRLLCNDPVTPEYNFAIKGRLMQVSSPYTFTFDGDVLLPEANGNWTEIAVRVQDVPGLITDVNFRFNGTDCNNPALTGMEHPYVGDLEVRLASPMGTTMTLLNHPGSTDIPAGSKGANFCHTVFDDQLPTTSLNIQDVSPDGIEAPYSESYFPAEPLAKFNGEPANGMWVVRFYDWAMPDQGRIHSFSIIITGEGGEVLANDAENWDMYK